MNNLCCLINPVAKCNDCNARMCSSHLYVEIPNSSMYWCEECGDNHQTCIEEINSLQERLEVYEEALRDWDEVVDHWCQNCREGKEPCPRLNDLKEMASSTHDRTKRTARSMGGGW